MFAIVSISTLSRINFVILNRKSSLGDGCLLYNWNYTHLSGLSYDDAIAYTQSHETPATISCTDKLGSHYNYIEEPGASIVSEANITNILLS